MLVESLSDGTVWLSPPMRSDVDEITRYCRHTSIQNWTTVPVPYTRHEAEVFVETVVPRGWTDRSPTWAVRSAAAGHVAGMIGLTARDESMAEIGYWLAPSMRSRGIMTAAVKLVCTFGFRSDSLHLQRIEWHAYVGNVASAAVARRAGFRYEGLLRAGGVQRGTRRDSWVAGLLPGDPMEPADGWPFGS